MSKLWRSQTPCPAEKHIAMSQAGAFPRMCETDDSTILNSLYCPCDSTQALSSYNNNRSLSQSQGTACVPHTTAAGLSPAVLSQGNLRFHSSAVITNSTTTVFSFPRHTELLLPSLAILHLSLGKIPPGEHRTNTAHRRGTCQTVMFYCSEQFTARGGSS